MIDENSILHRRDDESDKAYEAWGIFRDLGPKRNMDMLKDKLGLKSINEVIFNNLILSLEKIQHLEDVEYNPKFTKNV
jgi:hypothetical protein